MAIHYTHCAVEIFLSSSPVHHSHTLELPKISLLLALSSQLPHSQLSLSFNAKARV